MNLLADRLAEVEGIKLGEGKAKKKAETQVDTMAGNVRKWQVNTAGDLLSVVRAEVQPTHHPRGLRRKRSTHLTKC